MANSDSDTVSIINATNHTNIANVNVGDFPYSMIVCDFEDESEVEPTDPLDMES